MSTLRELPNVGKILEDNLLRVGLETPEQLRNAGAEDAFIRIRLHIDSGACLHMLYGMGVLKNVPAKDGIWYNKGKTKRARK